MNDPSFEDMEHRWLELAIESGRPLEPELARALEEDAHIVLVAEDADFRGASHDFPGDFRFDVKQTVIVRTDIGLCMRRWIPESWPSRGPGTPRRGWPRLSGLRVRG